MKLTILGTAPGKSLLNKSHSSYLVEKDNFMYLIDCGEGTSQKLLALNLMENQLDYIIISHLHPDHVSGIFILLQSLYLNKRNKDLFLFLPEGLTEFERFLEQLYIFKERLSYNLILQEYNTDTFSDFGLFPFLNQHLQGYSSLLKNKKSTNKMLSYSFVLEGINKKLLLSSDIRNMKDISKKLAEVDILILDGIHPSQNEINEVLKNSTLEVYITHGDYHFLQEKFTQLLGNKIKLAEENDEIII